MKATRFSELEFTEERFDREPGPIRAKLFICSTRRTGSYLLCRGMIHNGIALPHEYFNALHAGPIGRRWGIPGLNDGRNLVSDSKARRSYIDALLQRRVVNGTFAAKMHWDQYADYLDNPEGDVLLQNGHFIHLYREDLLAQAVSIHISRQTGRWGLDASVTTPPAEKPNFFDVDMIDGQMRSLAESDANWRIFFSRNDISPLRFSYEQLKGDLRGTLRTIVDCFGLDAPTGDLNYFEEGPSTRDVNLPARSEIAANFLKAKRRVTPGPRAARKVVDIQAASDASVTPPSNTSERPRQSSDPGKEEFVARLSPARRPAYACNGRQKIGLSMIVKNESQAIQRCLESVRSIIDYWVIVDTGSTDGTQDIITTYLADIPGELKESPWVDFSHNRNEALDLARPHCDYVFFIDADDVLELPPKFAIPIMSASSYYVEIRQKELRYWRPHLLRSDLPWRFEGVLHEFLTCSLNKNKQRTFPENLNPQRLAKAIINTTEGGARRQVAQQERYARDAALLEKALETETDPFLTARYTFYLGQSHRDAGNRPAALAAYLARASLGFWEQEVFISLYQAAVLKAELGYDPAEVIEAYQRAHAVDRRRAEALHGAARFCRVQGRFQEGYDFAKRALKMTAPETGLFVQQWIYDHGVLDEYAVCAYCIGRYEDCLKACRRILAGSAIPAAERPRVQANIDHALGKLRETQRSTV
jgi:LPS sulfotransferase NodH/glycosyltransferase involved in cell wall biosynthesis